MKGNKLGIVEKSLEEGSKKSALVTMEQLTKFREVRPTVSPTFDEDKNVVRKKIFVTTAEIPEDLWGPPLMEADWVATCPRNGGKMHNKKEVSRYTVVKKSSPAQPTQQASQLAIPPACALRSYAWKRTFFDISRCETYQDFF